MRLLRKLKNSRHGESPDSYRETKQSIVISIVRLLRYACNDKKTLFGADLNLKIKNFILVALFLFLSVFNPSCRNTVSSNKITITVSILPQKYFVEKIAGDLYHIHVMIPPGASPETYDPTPGQMASLAGSAIYFKIGQIEFEKNWINKAIKDYPDLKVIDTSSDIDFIEDADHGHHHDHGGVEPHIWMSPDNAVIIAQSIYQALAEYDPENLDFYYQNFISFAEQTEKLKIDLSRQLGQLQSKSFIIYHPALTYFARDFGLNQIAIEIDGKDPSPLQIKKLIDRARDENIRIVFVQKQFDKTKAEIISSEIDGEIVQIDPLDYNWDQQLTIIANKLANQMK